MRPVTCALANMYNVINRLNLFADDTLMTNKLQRKNATSVPVENIRCLQVAPGEQLQSPPRREGNLCQEQMQLVSAKFLAFNKIGAVNVESFKFCYCVRKFTSSQFTVSALFGTYFQSKFPLFPTQKLRAIHRTFWKLLTIPLHRDTVTLDLLSFSTAPV